MALTPISGTDYFYDSSTGKYYGKDKKTVVEKAVFEQACKKAGRKVWDGQSPQVEILKCKCFKTADGKCYGSSGVEISADAYNKKKAQESANKTQAQQAQQQKKSRGFFGSIKDMAKGTWESTKGAVKGAAKLTYKAVTDEEGNFSLTGGAKKIYKATKNLLRDENGKVSLRGAWKAVKAAGKGVLNAGKEMIKGMFADENGKFTWKSVLKGTGELALFATAIWVAAPALAAAAGISAVSAGAIIGLTLAAPLIIEGVNQNFEGANKIMDTASETDLVKAGQDAKAGLETQSKGVTNVVIGETMRRGIKKGATNHARTYEANLAKTSAKGKSFGSKTLFKVSTRSKALVKTYADGVKDVVTSPKKMVEAYRARKEAKAQTKAYERELDRGTSPERLQEIFDEVAQDENMSVKQKQKVYKKLANKADRFDGMEDFADAVRDKIQTPKYAKLETEIDNLGTRKRFFTRRKAARTEVPESKVESLEAKIDNAQRKGQITEGQAYALRERLANQQESIKSYSRLDEQFKDKKSSIQLDEDFDTDVSNIKNPKQRDNLMKRVAKSDLSSEAKMSVMQRLLDTCETENDILDFNFRVRKHKMGLKTKEQRALERIAYQKLQKINPKKYAKIDGLAQMVREDAKELKKSADKNVDVLENKSGKKHWWSRKRDVSTTEKANAKYAQDYANQHLAEVTKAAQTERTAEFRAQMDEGQGLKKLDRKIEKACDKGEITEAQRDALLDELPNAKENARCKKNYDKLAKKIEKAKAKNIETTRQEIETAKNNGEITDEQFAELNEKLVKREAKVNKKSKTERVSNDSENNGVNSDTHTDDVISDINNMSKTPKVSEYRAMIEKCETIEELDTLYRKLRAHDNLPTLSKVRGANKAERLQISREIGMRRAEMQTGTEVFTDAKGNRCVSYGSKTYIKKDGKLFELKEDNTIGNEAGVMHENNGFRSIIINEGNLQTEITMNHYGYNDVTRTFNYTDGCTTQYLQHGVLKYTEDVRMNFDNTTLGTINFEDDYMFKKGSVIEYVKDADGNFVEVKGNGIPIEVVDGRFELGDTSFGKPEVGDRLFNRKSIEELKAEAEEEVIPFVEEKGLNEEVVPKVKEEVAPKTEEVVNEEVAPKIEEEVAPKTEEVVNEEVAPKAEEEVAPKAEEGVNEEVAPKIEEEVVPKTDDIVSESELSDAIDNTIDALKQRSEELAKEKERIVARYDEIQKNPESVSIEELNDLLSEIERINRESEGLRLQIEKAEKVVSEDVSSAESKIETGVNEVIPAPEESAPIITDDVIVRSDVVDCPNSIPIEDMPASRYDFNSVEKPGEFKINTYEENGTIFIGDLEFEGKKYIYDEAGECWIAEDHTGRIKRGGNEYYVEKLEDGNTYHTHTIDENTGNVTKYERADEYLQTVTRDTEGNIVSTSEHYRIDGKEINVRRDANGNITETTESVYTDGSTENIVKDGTGRVIEHSKYNNNGTTVTTTDDYVQTYRVTEDSGSVETTFKTEYVGFKNGETLKVSAKNGEVTVEVTNANGTTQYPVDGSGKFIRNGIEYEVSPHAHNGMLSRRTIRSRNLDINHSREYLDRCQDAESLDALADVVRRDNNGVVERNNPWSARNKLLKEIEAKKQKLNNIDMSDVKLTDDLMATDVVAEGVARIGRLTSKNDVEALMAQCKTLNDYCGVANKLFDLKKESVKNLSDAEIDALRAECGIRQQELLGEFKRVFDDNGNVVKVEANGKTFEFKDGKYVAEDNSTFLINDWSSEIYDSSGRKTYEYSAINPPTEYNYSGNNLTSLKNNKFEKTFTYSGDVRTGGTVKYIEQGDGFAADDVIEFTLKEDGTFKTVKINGQDIPVKEDGTFVLDTKSSVYKTKKYEFNDQRIYGLKPSDTSETGFPKPERVNKGVNETPAQPAAEGTKNNVVTIDSDATQPKPAQPAQPTEVPKTDVSKTTAQPSEPLKQVHGDTQVTEPASLGPEQIKAKLEEKFDIDALTQKEYKFSFEKDEFGDLKSFELNGERFVRQEDGTFLCKESGKIAKNTGGTTVKIFEDSNAMAEEKPLYTLLKSRDGKFGVEAEYKYGDNSYAEFGNATLNSCEFTENGIKYRRYRNIYGDVYEVESNGVKTTYYADGTIWEKSSTYRVGTSKTETGIILEVEDGEYNGLAKGTKIKLERGADGNFSKATVRRGGTTETIEINIDSDGTFMYPDGKRANLKVDKYGRISESKPTETGFENAEPAPNQGEHVSTEVEAPVKDTETTVNETPAEEIVTPAFNKAEFEANIKTKIRDVKDVTEYEAIREEIRNSELSDTEKTDLLDLLERDKESRFPEETSEVVIEEDPEFIADDEAIIDDTFNTKPLEGGEIRTTTLGQKTGNAAKWTLGTFGAIAGINHLDSMIGAQNYDEDSEEIDEESDDIDEIDEIDDIDEVIDSDEVDELSETEEESSDEISEDDINNADSEEELEQYSQEINDNPNMSQEDKNKLLALINARKEALKGKDELSESDDEVSVDNEVKAPKSNTQTIDGGKYTIEKGKGNRPVIKDNNGKVVPVYPDGTVTINGKKFRVVKDGRLEEVKENEPQSKEFDQNTYKNRIQGKKDKDGRKPEINHQQVVSFTKAIQDAKTKEDLDNILKDMFTFKMFKGRKQLRTAIRAKRNVLKHANDAKLLAKKEEKIQKKSDRAIERFNDKRKSFFGIRLGKKVSPETNIAEEKRNHLNLSDDNIV